MPVVTAMITTMVAAVVVRAGEDAAAQAHDHQSNANES